MKHVFDTSEIAHLWAHQTQSDARNKQGNFFFEGDTIYSYGRHFPIARHIANKKGVKAILLTTDNYSVTTSGHIHTVRLAIPKNVQVFNVSRPDRMPDGTTLDTMQSEIDKLAIKASRARTNKDYLLSDLNRKSAELNACAEFIGVKRKAKLPDEAWIEKQKKEAAEQATKQRKARAEKDRINALEYAEKLELWKTGATVYLGNHHGAHFAYMRIEGDEIVTTQGARVPVDHVKKISALIIRLLDEGKTYQHNGHSIHIGHYLVESLDSDGVLTVGCHRFEASELRRIAALIGGDA